MNFGVPMVWPERCVQSSTGSHKASTRVTRKQSQEYKDAKTWHDVDESGCTSLSNPSNKFINIPEHSQHARKPDVCTAKTLQKTSNKDEEIILNKPHTMTCHTYCFNLM